MEVWKKLEDLYQTKLVSSKLYMKQKLLTFKMSGEKNLIEQLDEFNRSVDDLESLEVKLEDDDKALMLLNSLPKSFENFKDTLLFGRQDQLSLDEIQTAIKTKFLQIKGEKKFTSQGESLNLKYKKGKKGFQNKKKSDDKRKSDKKSGLDFAKKRKCFSWSLEEELP